MHIKAHSTIAVDFDGVIHKYGQGYKDGSIYDYPVEGAFEAIGLLQRKGYKIVIFTARKELKAVFDWCELWGRGALKSTPRVTNQKPPAICYIDDRAIRFTNWQDILNYF
jgi:hypothetical protein